MGEYQPNDNPSTPIRCCAPSLFLIRTCESWPLEGTAFDKTGEVPLGFCCSVNCCAMWGCHTSYGLSFGNFGQADMIEVVPRLQVLAQLLSLEDKKVLVEILKGIWGNCWCHRQWDQRWFCFENGECWAFDQTWKLRTKLQTSSIHQASRPYVCLQSFAVPNLTNLTAVVITFGLILLFCPLYNCFGLTLSWTPLWLWPLQPTSLTRRWPCSTVEMSKMILLQPVYQIAVILVFHLLRLHI